MNLVSRRAGYSLAFPTVYLSDHFIDCSASIVIAIGLFFLPVSTTLSFGVVLGGFLGLLSGGVRHSISALLTEPLIWCSVALLLYGLLRCANHQVPFEIAFHSYKKYAVHLIAFFLLLGLFSQYDYKHRFVSVIGAAIFCYSLLDICDKLGLLSIHACFHMPKNRFLSEIEFSEYCALGCLQFLGHITDKSQTTIYRIISFFVVLYVGVYLLFVNVERTGVLVCFSMCTYYLYHVISRGRQKFVIITLLIVMTCSAIWCSPSMRSRVFEGMSDIAIYQQGQPRTSLGLRYLFAQGSLALIKQRPIFGFGAGSFPELYRQQVGIGILPYEDTVGDPHNQFLHLWVDYGLVGALLFTGWLVCLFTYRHKGDLVQGCHRENCAQEQLLLKSLIVGFVLACLSTTAFYRARSGLLFVVYAALYL